MKQELSYWDIQDILPDHSDCGNAAEAHGLLAGLLCMDAGVDREFWLNLVFGPEAEVSNAGELAPWTRLFEATRRQLDDFDFSFTLLLPDDDNPLEERADALGEWCRGFLLGLGYGSKDSNWPGECTELLQDFVEITRLDPAASGEADEAAFEELAEYVRVGVQVIQGELRSRTPQRLH